jgi:hypothetical protein
MVITPEQIAGESESSQQKALMVWASLNRLIYPQLKWLHAIPNANSHRQVAEGVRGGVADIFLPWPRFENLPIWTKCYHGLYIELKTEERRKEKNGGCSKNQIEFGLYCGASGYMWYCCYGWEEARDRILEYLK